MTEDKHPGGRPSKYKPEYAEQARKACLLWGGTDEELARFFDVDVATIYRWKNEHDEFCEAVKQGKAMADANVAQRLFERAMGYSHDEDKIFQYEGEPVVVPTVKHYPPDTTAAIFWLKNRQPERWREKTEQTLAGPDGGPIQTNITERKVVYEIVRAKPIDITGEPNENT